MPTKHGQPQRTAWTRRSGEFVGDKCSLIPQLFNRRLCCLLDADGPPLV